MGFIDNVKSTATSAANAVGKTVENMKNIPSWIPTSISDTPEDFRDTLFKNPKIFAEKILKEIPVSASITMPMQSLSSDGNAVYSKTVTIPFYMKDNFSVGSLTNNWSTLINMDMVNTFADLLNVAASFTGSAQVSLQSEAMSLQSWKGSSFSDFSVSCLFVATNRKINPTKIIQTLAAAALPTKLKGDLTAGAGIENIKQLAEKGISAVGNAIAGLSDSKEFKEKVNNFAGGVNDIIADIGMVAPLHYGIDKSDPNRPYAPAKGTTLTLQVGDYFRATELVVTSISNITFSKEIIAPKTFNNSEDRRRGDLYDPHSDADGWGFPLYGECTVGLRPCSMMTKEKFESYFINLHDQGNSVVDKVRNSLASFKLPTI